MKKLLVSLSLLAMSFSGFAKDITEGDLQSYMKALPAITSWASSQDALKNVDLGSMLGATADQTTAEQGALAKDRKSVV